MGEPEPEAELADIRAALAEEHATAHEPVFRWKYRYPLFLAISIGAFNQLAGINAILYYLNSIFARPASARSPATSRPSPSAPQILFSPLWA